MAASAVRILLDADLHRRMAEAGVRIANERFSADRVVPMYEAVYEGREASMQVSR
jgi:L-malate glycosyltransferase